MTETPWEIYGQSYTDWLAAEGYDLWIEGLNP